MQLDCDKADVAEKTETHEIEPDGHPASACTSLRCARHRWTCDFDGNLYLELSPAAPNRPRPN